MAKDNLILDKTFDFALKIISLYKILTSKNEYVLSKQILRAGTSVGANVEEAVGGHSKKDFVAKMIIAYKEARETRYWLRLLERSQLVKHDYTSFLSEIQDIINILTAIIKSSKE
ncbi:MAG: four helix bundle protein [Bacteroidetes bacterium]|nr:four helix bundle protein [Bacteroidota bacterium]